MSKISKAIDDLNKSGNKALSVFLTAGYPDVENFVNLAVEVYNAGADIIELGIPFSDPLADGPVIQQSSEKALANGITLAGSLELAKQIKSKVDKPLILMGYANPLRRMGIDKFINGAKKSGVDGLIIPDVPLEEYDSFFDDRFNDFDVVLLTTPTSSEERIKQIDELSGGFVYCVSVTGTTGVRNGFDDTAYSNLKRTKKILTKNKMMIGFGISSGENIKQFSEVSDGFIVGSAVIKSLMNNNNYDKTLELVKELSDACQGI